MVQMKITDLDTTDDTESDDGGLQFIALVHRPNLSELDAPVRQVMAVADTVTNGAAPDAAERARISHDVVSGEYELDERTPILSVAGGVVSWSCCESRENADGAIKAAGRESVPHLVVDKLDTLGRTHAAIAERVRRAVDAGVTLHLTGEGFDISPENADTVLGVLAGLDACGVELERETRERDIREWLDDSRAIGRPPLGFAIEDGKVVPADNMDDVRAVLSMRRRNDISKRKAAERLGVSPRTISRAMDNIERYNLRPPAEDPEEMPGRV